MPFDACPAQTTPGTTLTAIRSFETSGDLIASGLFAFHGTCEPFPAAELKPGSFDGLLWTATAPGIAQAYIPTSGVSALFSVSAFQLEDRVRPATQDLIWSVLVPQMGFATEQAEPEFDAAGAAVSWRIADGHPRYRDVLEFVRGLGYGVDADETAWLKTTCKSDGRDVVRPADYRMPGRVFIAYSPSLRVYGLCDDLNAVDAGEKQHLAFGAFELAREMGFDGVGIGDLLQSERHGNVGHLATGLVRRTVDQLDWVVFDAVNHDPEQVVGAGRYDGFRSTPDFDRFFESVRATTAPA